MTDARFEDAGEGPLRLRAETPEDLTVISALLQDAVTEVGEVHWLRRHRELAVLFNRFRWEDKPVAERAGRPFERVRSVLMIGDVSRVVASGIDPAAPDTVLSLLALEVRPGEDGTARIELAFAGDGTVAADVECIAVSLTDVTRPYVARAGAAPAHDD